MPMFWFFLDLRYEETAFSNIVRWLTSNILHLLTNFTRVILLLIFAHKGLLRTKSPSTIPKTFRLPHFPAATQPASSHTAIHTATIRLPLWYLRTVSWVQRQDRVVLAWDWKASPVSSVTTETSFSIVSLPRHFTVSSPLTLRCKPSLFGQCLC